MLMCQNTYFELRHSHSPLMMINAYLKNRTFRSLSSVSKRLFVTSLSFANSLASSSSLTALTRAPTAMMTFSPWPPRVMMSFPLIIGKYLLCTSGWLLNKLKFKSIKLLRFFKSSFMALTAERIWVRFPSDQSPPWPSCRWWPFSHPGINWPSCFSSCSFERTDSSRSSIILNSPFLAKDPKITPDFLSLRPPRYLLAT